jgi:hypothetical protein
VSSVTLATVVDWAALGDAALASLVAGVAVTAIASTTIYGAATSAEARRNGRGGVAILAAALAVVGGLAFAATIAVGLYVMIHG